MGFTFRKRNPKGLNFSISSRGARVSKTIKLGKMTFNLGRYIGGTQDGKTNLKTRVSSNGFMYEKNKTITSASKVADTNPQLTKHFTSMVDNESFPEKYTSKPADEPKKVNPISRMYLSEWGPWVVIVGFLIIVKGLNMLTVYNRPLSDALEVYHFGMLMLAAAFVVPWLFMLPYMDFDNLSDFEWNNTLAGAMLIRFEAILAFIVFTLFVVPNVFPFLFSVFGWFFRA